jgi:hypothetical protein
MLTPVSISRLTLCFSILSITWGSSDFMVVTRAWMEGPGTCHWVGGSVLKDSMPFNDHGRPLHVSGIRVGNEDREQAMGSLEYLGEGQQVQWCSGENGRCVLEKWT